MIISNKGSGKHMSNLIINQAKKALEKKDWKTAREFFEKVISEEPQNAEAYLGYYMATDRIQAKDYNVLKERIIHRKLPQNDYYDYALRYADGNLLNMLTSWEQEKSAYIKEKEKEKQIKLTELRAKREELRSKIDELETDTLMLEKNEQINAVNREIDYLYKSLIFIPEIHEEAQWEYKILSNEGMIKLLHFWQKKEKERYLEQNKVYQIELDRVKAKIRATENDINIRLDEAQRQLEQLKIEQAEIIANQKAQSEEEKYRAEKLLPSYREEFRRVKSDINFINYDTVKFGSYIQQANTTEKEPIEWLVLDEMGDRKLLISRYCLACHQFNPKHTEITWATSEIRKWLNEDFINEAFSSDEQVKICKTALHTPKNDVYNTPGGKDTTDKVFFLDLAEAQKYFYVNNERACDSTPYARQQGAYVYSGASWWWLRSPGANRKFAADIHISGAVFPLGDFGISFLHGVRPALWVNL